MLRYHMSVYTYEFLLLWGSRWTDNELNSQVLRVPCTVWLVLVSPSSCWFLLLHLHQSLRQHRLSNPVVISFPVAKQKRGNENKSNTETQQEIHLKKKWSKKILGDNIYSSLKLEFISAMIHATVHIYQLYMSQLFKLLSMWIIHHFRWDFLYSQLKLIDKQ